MNKKFDISNVRYELISSSHPGYKEVQVLFTHQGKEEKHFIFIKDEGKKNYVKEAKKIFKQDLKSGKVVQALKVTPGGKHPILITSIAVVGVAAIATASYFTYKYLNNPGPAPAVSHTFTFHGTNCKINNQYTYTHDIFEDDKNVQYTITPEEGYKLPATVEGGGSYDSATGIITISEIKEDITVSAKGIELPPEPGVTHTVHLNPNGGKLTGDDTIPDVEDGGSITKPEVTREGYNASEVEWYKTADFQTDSKFDFDKDKVRSDLLLHAKWGEIKQFDVTFYEGNGGTKPQTKKVNYGEKPIYYTPTGKAGDTFLGWFTTTEGTTQYNFNDPIKDEGVKIYSKWKELGPEVSYNVKFNVTDCSVTYNGSPVDPAEGKTIVVPQGVDPFYVKFSIKSSNDNYMKPGSVELKNGDSEYSDYLFDKNSGDLYINLKSNLVVSGSCNAYKTLEECTWVGINSASAAGKAQEAFKIGETKEVQLKHQDSNNDGADIISEGELYQTVRIIGFNHDSLSSGGGNAGITFEFADLISDEAGYSIATPWNLVDEYGNYNYLNSNLRKALDNGGEATDIYWCRKGETAISEEEPYTKSVFDMLPDDLSANGIIKEVIKPVAVHNGTEFEVNTTEYKAKLFPLSYRESTASGTSAYALDEGSPYEFYTGSRDNDDNRIKHQIKWHDGAATQETSFDFKELTRHSYAGVNLTLQKYGGDFWLRSPNKTSTSAFPSDTFRLTARGDFIASTACDQMFYAVSPAFCI